MPEVVVPPVASSAPGADAAGSAPGAGHPTPSSGNRDAQGRFAASPTAAPSPPAPGADSTPAPAWPDDWRARMAAGDDKKLKQLERFASPQAVFDSYGSLHARLSSGELKAAPPKDGKPEDLARWRSEMGIPAAPKDYPMPDGLTIGDDDKPLIDKFVTAMHGTHATPAQVQTAISTYFDMQAERAEMQAEADDGHKAEVEDALRQEWGVNYRRNVQGILNFLSAAPGDISSKLQSARMSDGRALLNDPAVVRWMADMQHQINPAATLVPPGVDTVQSLTDEINGLKAKMADPRSDYWQGPNASKNQDRYRQLIEAKAKIKP